MKKEMDLSELLHITLLSIGDAVIATDRQGHITFMNPVGESLTGWNFEEAKGKHLDEVFKIINEKTRQVVKNPITRAIREGVVVGLANHTVLISKNGKEIPIDDSAAPIKDKKGELIGAVLVFRDVTERKRAEETQSWLSAIIHFSDDAIISKTLDGVIMSWNRGAERIFGYTEKEAVGKHITLIIPEDRLSEEHKVLTKIRKGEYIEHFETERKTKDGRTVHISLTVSPIKNAKGEIIGASKIARDITETRLARETIRNLATPVLQIRPGLLILPLIGMIDNQRIVQVREEVLSKIRMLRAKVIVLDLTGVVFEDKESVQQILSIVEASRLMGTQVILTGMGKEFGEALLSANTKFDMSASMGDLQGGIEAAEEILKAPRL